ncbi:two-component regulator propeller domain-containing protein [Megalodesulfovibrio gigas]|uniref:histidine kinase n=1 Tax=Megalodesulfovibrio gigas (strain ATCC 19364 / DSM 1382 / NCIMB 9332 / VKM B-1759) TaxID=1121448 RepID=T2GDA5_MEGG1|nr:two-component regulator propeller domain-containing protein [Megalodesulfovibrio gigas]AGW13902.1 putative two-component hybrid sensor and regulator [Megalodesulfovibrio gigas DSM 1382 = ATCC 19364]
MVLLVVMGAGLAGPGTASTLPVDLRFERIGLEQGLSQASVLSSVKDSQGFLWFGTYDGLNRYDGLNFHVYQSRDESGRGLSDDGIRTLVVDAQGVLWAATSAGGVNRYNREDDSFTAFMHDPNNPGSLSSNEIEALLVDAQGVLWVGTSNGIDRMQPDGSFVHLEPSRADGSPVHLRAVKALAQDEHGRIWAGSEESLLCLTPQGEVLAEYGQAPGASGKPLAVGTIQCLLTESRDGVWIGGSDGLYHLDPAAGEGASYLAGDSVKFLFRDSRGILWVGTDAGLARRLPAATAGETDSFLRYRRNPFDPHSLSSDDVYSMLEDDSGILWLGTYTEGLCKMNPRTQEFHLIRSEPWHEDWISDSNVNAVLQDEHGILWLGTTYGGLNRVDLATRQVQVYRAGMGSFPAQEVRSLALDKEGRLWLGTSDAGVLQLDRTTGEFIQHAHNKKNPQSLGHNNVYCIYDDGQDSLWIGLSKAGLNRLDKRTGLVERFDADPGNPDALQHKRVRVILEHGGRLWLGTSGGLHLLDRETGRFRHWEHDPKNPHSLLDDKVTALLAGPGPDTLWVGTNSGLCLFDLAAEQFFPFTPAQGCEFPNLFIAAMLKDGVGDLWVSTFKGLSRFTPMTREVRNYTPLEGLQGYEFMERSAFRNATGEMFFGGLKGLTWFHPDRILPNPHLPPVVLTGVSIMNAPMATKENVTLLREVTLSHRDVLFRFSFAALDFSAPFKNTVAYMLEGFDQDWITTRPGWSASYTSIEPGQYRFRARAANSDGAWNPQELQLVVHILPPFWQTAWFRVLLGVAALTALYLFYSLRVRLIKQHNRRLEDLVAERTKSLAITHAQLQGIMQHAPCAIALKDALRRYTLINPQFENFFQTCQDIVHERTDAEIFDKETVALLSAADQEAWDLGKSAIFEMAYANRLLLVQQVAFRDAHGEPYALCGIALDVTEKKQLEAEALRAGQLASIGELAAGVAHEINNPITGIINYTQLLQDGYGSDIPDMTQKILLLADRVATIARGLLSYSRSDREKPKPADLREVVTDSLSLSRYRFEKEGFHVEVELPDTLPHVQCRARELQQVLLNLLSNAFHALKEKRLKDDATRLTCTVRVYVPDEKSDHVRLEVHDTGVGIPAAHLGKVCQPFFTTKPRNEGTGLGLSISSNIVARHDGLLTVASEEGRYTVVQVDLPALAQDGSV